jgi:Flp pilus assembly protein TadB
MGESQQWASESGVSRPSRPMQVRRIRESDLERTATQLGMVAGKALAVYRGIRRTLKEQKKDQKQESGGLSAWMKERAEEKRQAAAQRIGEWRRAARDKTAELRRRRQDRTGEQEYPLHVVLAAGAVGLLLGAVLGVLKAHNR